MPFEKHKNKVVRDFSPTQLTALLEWCADKGSAYDQFRECATKYIIGVQP